MNVFLIVWLQTACCITSQLPTRDSDDAKKVVQRALASSGGKENLAKLQVRKVVTKGKLFSPDGKTVVGIRLESWNDIAKGRLKHVVKLELANRSQVRIRVLDGEVGWERIDGDTKPFDDKAIKALHQSQFEARAKLLYPLLEDPQFGLTLAGNSKINMKDVVAIKVSAKGRDELTMYFDKENFLLAKLSMMSSDPPLKEAVLREDFYEGYLDKAGVKFPTKRAAYRGGKKYIEDELESLEPLDRIDPSVFAKP